MPILAGLLTGTMMLGNYLSVRNSLKSALDETSRYAALYPTPTDDQIKARFKARLTRTLDQNKLIFKAERVSVSTQVRSVTLSAAYPVTVDFIFANAGTIEASAKRKVFVAN